MTDRRETVIAVDPGKMTGIAMLRRVNDEVTVERSAEASEDSTIPVIRAWWMDWQMEVDDTLPLRIVCETFTITVETGKKKDVNYSLEQIGALKQLCRDKDYAVEAIVFQKPSEAKTVFPNPKLKRLGLWHRGGHGHALDAIRHGAVYLLKSGWSDARFIE